jgi:hypothetical protein
MKKKLLSFVLLATFFALSFATYVAAQEKYQSVTPNSLSSIQGTLMPTLFFDGSSDSQLTNIHFNESLVDSQGRLILHGSCLGFASCSNLYSISTNGTLNWTSSDVGRAAFSDKHLLLGPDDRAYFLADGATIFAFNALGNPVSGFPVTLPYVFGTSYNPVVIDQTDGTIFARTGVTYSFSAFPVAITALNADGSQKWRTDYPNENEGGRGILQSINGNIYTFIRGVGLTVLDKNNGNEICTTPNATGYYGSFVGGADGVFSSFQNVVSSYGSNCASGTIFQQQDRDTELRHYQNGVIYAIDYPLYSSEANQTRLLALSKEGSLLWRATDVFPVGAPVRAVKNNVLYMIGQHVTDGNKQKLFLLDALTGAVLNSVETSPFCLACSVAAANDGTVYLNDLSSTKIYKIAPSQPPNQTPTAGFTMTSGSQSATEGQTLKVTAPTSLVFVNFSAARSSDSDGTVNGWEWKIDGNNVSTASNFTYGLNHGNHTVSLVVTDNEGSISQEASGQVVIVAAPATIIRTPPYDSFNGCNNTNEITGGGKFSHASSIVSSDPTRGKVDLNVQAAGIVATAFGQTGVGVNYESDFSGQVKIKAFISVEGFDLLTGTSIRKLPLNGTAFVESDVFITANPPVDAKSKSRFRAALLGDSGNLLNNIKPAQLYSVEHIANVTAGQRLRICAGIQSNVGVAGFPGLFVSSKALYKGFITRIEIIPE